MLTNHMASFQRERSHARLTYASFMNGPTRRHWARSSTKVHSNVTGNLYNVVFGAHQEGILSVAHYLDGPQNTTRLLSTASAPLTVPELALCIVVFALRILSFAALF